MAAQSPRPFLLPTQSPSGPAKAPDLAGQPARVPTGVPDFDYITGGMPTGSVVLLWGEAGAGHQEFALTSAVHLMLHYDLPRLHEFYLGSAKGPFVYPEGVVYISTSRSKDQVLDEVRGSFDPTYGEVLGRHLTFLDLSREYFQDTVVPSSWSAVPSPLLGARSPTVGADGGPLRALADGIDPAAGRKLVIVDSLTDLLVRRGVDAGDLITLLKGLRRRAKEWNAVVYLILSEGVAPSAVEQAVIDSVDGVLHFTWTTSPSHSHRQRTMLIEKFMPILARVPAEYHGRFVIRVGSVNGLVTTQYERI
ncbi:MAG: RAD55 family ATPase [Thermoplasmata archaeon]|nr:RAD55 family ATPase [Thermoplasmata archaeon]